MTKPGNNFQPIKTTDQSSNMENYRTLTPDEIAILESNNCTADNWQNISVGNFVADRYHNVCFSGKIILGNADGCHSDPSGVKKPCGIYNATIHNCEIGDNVRISDVTGAIANYRIGNNSSISSVGNICCHKNAMFGNGTIAETMDETGGRAVRFYDRMTAQIAYLCALYRHRPDFTSALEKIGDDYISSCQSDIGTIGHNVTISNCPSIIDVNICDVATVKNVSSLLNGTIGPKSHVADNVVARNFIIGPQASVTNGATLENTLIGQATTIANGFSASHSLIFANCNFQCGEACSIIAGPHTESHHRSTLLIGGIFSFFNAGSGTNQSNHMYRLGPIHHGIMERGCKTGSNSYVLWPAHFGQFSIILGSHYDHPDTSMFPYSTVIGKQGKTFVKPGAVVCSAGLIRDLMKWPKRDRRDPAFGKKDVINYDIINPLNVSKMYRGLKLLNQYETDPDAIAPYNFHLKYDSVVSGRENYAFAIDYFLGKYVTQLINDTELTADKPLSKQLFPEPLPANEGWIDLLGLLAPRNYIRQQIVIPVTEGKITSISQLTSRIHDIDRSYIRLVYQFIHQNFQKAYSIEADKITPKAMLSILQRWTETVSVMENRRITDGMKEFDRKMLIGFSPDDKNYIEMDFNAVRGNPQDNPQLKAIHEHYVKDLNNCYHAMNKLKTIFGS